MLNYLSYAFDLINSIRPELLLLFSLLLVHVISVVLSELRASRIIENVAGTAKTFDHKALATNLRKELSERVSVQIYEIQKDLLVKLAQLEVGTSDKENVHATLDDVMIKMEQLEDAVSTTTGQVINDYFSPKKLEVHTTVN